MITAPAGTKRIGNEGSSLKWSARLIDKYLLDEADKRGRELVKQGRRGLCIQERRGREKPESDESEGVGPVLSSQSKRRTRSKKGQGLHEPRATPGMGTGMHGQAALIVGMQGLPQVALMKWGTTKGDSAENQPEAEREMVRHLAYTWKTLLRHLFDRGYASLAWLALAEALHGKLVIRWIKSHRFLDAMGQEKKLWHIGHTKNYFSQKLVKDVKTGSKSTCDLWWAPLTPHSDAGQLSVVKIRSGKQIMRLITNERLSSDEQAWESFFASTRRWQMETAFRYGKSELAMESPCLRIWEPTLKLLGRVTLVYAFLLYLLQETLEPLQKYLLRLKCHRTGKRCQNAQAPLYRFRWALSRLWEEHPPVRTCFFPPSLPMLRLLTALRGQTMG